MNLQYILHDPPKLHRDGQGNPVSWKLSNQVLSLIDRSVNSNHKTLETGAGVSTILFAIKETEHTCITPHAKLVDRIKEYCHTQGISTQKIDFQLERSEDVLPHLAINNLDLILIDGRHAFPSPFIDWYYSANKLRNNGILIVDDTLIWTGKVLKDFLLSESEWELAENFLDASAFTKKGEQSHQKYWGEQPYVNQKSNYAFRHMVYRINKATQYLLRGEFSALQKDLKQVFGSALN